MLMPPFRADADFDADKPYATDAAAAISLPLPKVY